MLEILFLCPYVPHIGVHAGAGRLFNLIIRLSRKHNISMLAYLGREEEKQYIPELEKYCQKVKVIYRSGGSFLFDFSPKRPFYHDYSLEMKKELLAMLDEKDYDILQIEYSELAHYIFHAPPIPAALSIHELISRRIFDFFRYEKNIFKKSSLLLKYLSYLNYEMNICKRFDRVITFTENDRRDLMSFSPKVNTFVVPTGVDISYFQPGTIKEEVNSLLYVGYFGHRPNADAVLYFCRDILPLIRRKVPNVKLYIVGAYPTSEILNLANEYIFVTGRVDDLRPYYDKAQVFIAPVRIGGGIRGKILEAWAMHKAVVSTPLAATGIEAFDGRNILVANGEKDFAEKAILLLRNEELRKKMGLEGRKTVEEKFGWDKIADSLTDLYQELAKEKQ